MPPFQRSRVKAHEILPHVIVKRLGLSAPEPVKVIEKRISVNLKRSATVLNISSNDWANYSYYNCASLNAAGIDCIGLKLHPHSFGYKEQHEVVTPTEMAAIIRTGSFKIIQVFNSDWTMLNYLQGFKGRVVVYHTGTGYRNNSDKLNAKFTGVWKSIIALSEFEYSGAKNAEYLSVAVDVEKMQPEFTEVEKPYRFLHVPSHANVKGTEQIKKMFKAAKINIRCDVTRLDHEASWARMRNCDIYVELFKPILDERPYGSFGTTAAEAAALGKIVVTQNLNSGLYERTYGDCPLILAKDEQDFVQKIKWLNSLPEKEILHLQQAHRDWAVNKHSFKATGERLKQILEL
ncbi:MAG: glycosyltransferase [Bacteroidia bacterium]|nr:glycosyltransferase [Bacteroidia bacterium]